MKSALGLLNLEHQREEAIQYLTDRIDGKTQVLRAGCYAQTKEYAKAKEDLDLAIQSFSSSTVNSKDSKKWVVIALNERGLVKCYLGDFAGAIEDFTQVLSVEAARVEARYTVWAQRGQAFWGSWDLCNK